MAFQELNTDAACLHSPKSSKQAGQHIQEYCAGATVFLGSQHFKRCVR
jgi:hypothetical protein